MTINLAGTDLPDLIGEKVRFKLWDTTHGLDRSRGRGITDTVVYDKIKEALPQIEEVWLARKKYTKGNPEFACWIRSESLKLNLIVNVRTDRRTGAPGMSITTKLVQEVFYPHPGDIKFTVAKKGKRIFTGNIMITGVVATLLEENKWLGPMLKEDLAKFDLQYEIPAGAASVLHGSKGLGYCIENTPKGKFLIHDITYAHEWPDLSIIVT